MARLYASLVAAALVASSSWARADILAPGAKTVDYTYEITNLAEHPDTVFVEWPRLCIPPRGEPMGDPNRRKMPGWESRLHEIDYEVLKPGPHELLRFCGESAHIYALSAAAFPTDTRVAKEDNWGLGLKSGQTYAGVAALESMTVDERIPFFASDPRVRRASYPIAYILVLRESSPLKTIHDVLRIESLDASHVVIAPVKVRYGYEDGTSEELAWTGGKHPRPPGKPDALLGFGKDAVDYGDGDASAPPVRPPFTSEASSSTGAPAPSGPWPMRLVVGGLLLAIGVALGRRLRSR